MTDNFRFSRLVSLTETINSNHNLRVSLEHVVTAISEEIIRCNCVGIYLAQPDGTFRGYVGKPDNIKGITLDQMVIDPSMDQLAQDVISQKKSIYIADTSLDKRPDPRPIEIFQIKSLLALPIAYEDELFGLVYMFDYGIPMNLTTEEIESVEAYVNMAAVAIRNANLIKRQQVLLSEKQLLLDATREFAMKSSVQEVLDVCFKHIGTILENQNIGLYLTNTIGQSLRPSSLSKNSDWTEEEWQRVHSSINMDFEKDPLYSEAIKTKKPVLVPDALLDPRPNPQAIEKFGVRGIFLLPLVATGDVLGVLSIVSLGVPRTYTDSQIQLAQSIADATATALANVVRMEQLEMIVRTRTTELRERNGMLEQVVEELRSVDKSRNEFLASVSHELRTPMTAILGSIELLRMNVMGELNAEQKELVEMAEQGMSHLLKKVNDLLDLTKFQSGSFSIEKCETDYAKIVQHTVDLVTPMLSQKGQKLVLNLRTNTVLNIDSERIEQVLLNLLTNAHKFTPKSGTITLHVEDTDEGVLTCVEDTGIGIPESSLDKIFNRFYQVTSKNTDDRRYSGTGLGLSIAKQIIELHDGEIWVESEVDKGSRFYFLLHYSRQEGGVTVESGS